MKKSLRARCLGARPGWRSGQLEWRDVPDDEFRASQGCFSPGCGRDGVFVPYLVPVAPTISLSYVVGYNNRVALLLFVAAALAFAYLTRGVLARTGNEQDQPMRRADLLIGLAVVLVALLARHHRMQPPKSEAAYAIDRLQMLVSGVRPYTGFEFVYGPLQLYLPLLVSRVFRTSVVIGYYAWWYTQWLTGTWMLWWMIKQLPGKLKRRRFILPPVLFVLIFNMLAEGTAYTPVRMIGAAFFVLAVNVCWQRTRNPMILLAAAAAATLFEFGISPEQGIAVGLGLLGWILLKAWRQRSRDLATAAAGQAIAFALICLWFKWLGVFGGLREFAGGAYSFPMLPALTTALLLLAYVAAACAAVRAWLDADLDGPSIAMALCGFAALPAAFGRCDTGHLQLGSAALFLGIASIETMPKLRRVWTSLLLLLMVIAPFFFVIQFAVAKVGGKIPPPGPDPHNLPARESADAGGAGIVLSAPCPVVYRTPTIWPTYLHTAAQECLETGFFAGMLDVLTVETIDRKVREITAEPRRPLLLQAGPLAEQFTSAPTEIETRPMRDVLGALYLPPLRHKAMDYTPVIRAIEDNYTPGPVVAGGLQIWEPKTVK